MYCSVAMLTVFYLYDIASMTEKVLSGILDIFVCLYDVFYCNKSHIEQCFLLCVLILLLNLLSLCCKLYS